LPTDENRLKGARRQSGLTRARMASGIRAGDLARALGLSSAWVSGVEHDRIIPTLQQKIEIAQILGLPIEMIFDDEGEDGA